MCGVECNIKYRLDCELLAAVDGVVAVGVVCDCRRGSTRIDVVFVTYGVFG